jgi:hypothetical protein
MLRFLRGVGIPVGTIIDVGAREETLESRQAFPDLRHILFEPASEFHDALRTNYASMDYVLVPAALSDQEGRGYLCKIAIGGNKISHSWLVAPAPEARSNGWTTPRIEEVPMDGRYRALYRQALEEEPVAPWERRNGHPTGRRSPPPRNVVASTEPSTTQLRPAARSRASRFPRSSISGIRAHGASTSSPSASGTLLRKAERADPKEAGGGASPRAISDRNRGRFHFGMTGDLKSE